MYILAFLGLCGSLDYKTHTHTHRERQRKKYYWTYLSSFSIGLLVFCFARKKNIKKSIIDISWHIIYSCEFSKEKVLSMNPKGDQHKISKPDIFILNIHSLFFSCFTLCLLCSTCLRLSLSQFSPFSKLSCTSLPNLTSKNIIFHQILLKHL